MFLGTTPLKEKYNNLGESLPLMYVQPYHKGTIQRFVHTQLASQISLPVPSCTSTMVPRSCCVLGLPQHVQ